MNPFQRQMMLGGRPLAERHASVVFHPDENGEPWYTLTPDPIVPAAHRPVSIEEFDADMRAMRSAPRTTTDVGEARLREIAADAPHSAPGVTLAEADAEAALNAFHEEHRTPAGGFL